MLEQRLVALLDEPARRALAGSPQLRQLLAEALARAGADDAAAPATLLPYLAERFPSGDNLEQTLAVWCSDELRLCHDCVGGDAAALAAFEARIRPVIRGTLMRLRLAEPLREELEQALFAQLLVGDVGKAPLVSSYRGVGKLEAWVRVVVARQGRKALGRAKKLVPEADIASKIVDPAISAELAGAKHAYRQVFAEAFRHAVSALEPRQATLLRQRYADGLTLQQIGAVYRVHHETARRWLEAVHQALLAQTRALMAARLDISTDELDTVMHLIQTNLDLTLDTFFGGAGGG